MQYLYQTYNWKERYNNHKNLSLQNLSLAISSDRNPNDCTFFWKLLMNCRLCSNSGSRFLKISEAAAVFIVPLNLLTTLTLCFLDEVISCRRMKLILLVKKLYPRMPKTVYSTSISQKLQLLQLSIINYVLIQKY